MLVLIRLVRERVWGFRGRVGIVVLGGTCREFGVSFRMLNESELVVLLLGVSIYRRKGLFGVFLGRMGRMDGFFIGFVIIYKFFRFIWWAFVCRA